MSFAVERSNTSMKKRYDHLETQVQVAEYTPIEGSKTHVVTSFTEERLNHIKEYENMGYEMCGVAVINCTLGELYYRYYWKKPVSRWL